MVGILSTVRCLNGADGQRQVTFHRPNEHVHREPKPARWQAFWPLGTECERIFNEAILASIDIASRRAISC